MFCQKLFILFLISSVLTDSDVEKLDVEKLFKDTKIIPDMLKTAPKEKLKIEYADGLMVGDGKNFTPTQTKDAPKIDWPADPDQFYTIYMASPDAPDVANPIWGEFLHWLVVNVPGKDLDKGEVYCPYIGVLAPKKGGIMRYVFLVYEQPSKLEFNEPFVDNSKVEGHPNFKIEQFAMKYNLGQPLAGNIYRSQWDKYVPILHEQMGVTVDTKKNVENFTRI